MERRREALDSLVRTFPDRRMVVVGAAALEMQEIDLPNKTLDLDVAIEATVEHVLVAMESGPDWEADPKKIGRWIGSQGETVDLIPAGRELLETGGVAWPGQDRELNLQGFQHLWDDGQACLTEEHHLVPAAVVPLVALLKVIAWLDRPAVREKDLVHLTGLMDEFLSISDDRGYVGPTAERDIWAEEACAWWLGFDMGRIATDSEKVRLEHFFDLVVEPESSAVQSLASLAPLGWKRSTTVVVRRFALLRDGFEQGFRSG